MRTGGMQSMLGEDDDGHPIEVHEQSFRRADSEDDIDQKYLVNPRSSDLVHVPNQHNSFFASGFKMVDANVGDLEKIYKSNNPRPKTKPSVMSDDLQTESILMQEDYFRGKPIIDRTNQILKRIQMQTPGSNVNISKIKRIQAQARNKVDYTYKERFCGIYEEKKRKG